jgi:hypothetical protein
MKTNELRIGNYVNDRLHREVVIKKIREEHLIFNLSNGSKIKHNIKTFEPIPLTEEWLLKFGFVKLDYHRFKIKPSHYFDYYYTYSVKDYCFRMYVEDAIMCLSTPECVHQLQNLYFAITEEELTFNK